jgi:hypothetical protein
MAASTVVQIVRRFAHAHEHHFLHRANTAGEHHLRHDLQAAHLTNQAALARHAEAAPHGTAYLRRHAERVARQQHAFDHLTVGQFHQQARRPGPQTAWLVTLFCTSSLAASMAARKASTSAMQRSALPGQSGFWACSPAWPTAR